MALAHALQTSESSQPKIRVKQVVATNIFQIASNITSWLHIPAENEI
jgi:hypothetical protein